MGEQALLFLENRGVDDLVTPESVKRLLVATGGAGIRRVAWSGRGYMPVPGAGGTASG